MLPLLCLTIASFKEDFETGFDGWVTSDWNADKMGVWEHIDGGLSTAKNASFYAISRDMQVSFSTRRDLFVQYTVRNPQNIDCGGAYLKLFPSTVDQSTLKGGDDEDKYSIMFGPDFCGATKKTHLIFHHTGKNYENTKTLAAIQDTKLHLYTLGLYTNGTYAYWLDGDLSKRGDLRGDYAFLAPREIPDPAVEKPSDWVDSPTMPDPTDSKPSGWDDVPSEIPDPDATEPDDWSVEDDGYWEAPMISNPDFKGEWTPKMIENPEYKGDWVHPMIANPEFKDDPTFGVYNDIRVLAFELWQVKAGTIFDHIRVTHEIDDLRKFDELEQDDVESTTTPTKEEL